MSKYLARIPAAYLTTRALAAHLAGREQGQALWTRSPREQQALGQYREQLSAMYAEFKPAIAKALTDVNGKAGSFTLGVDEAISLAVDTERRLDRLGVPKAARGGTEAWIRSAGPSAKSYKYTVIGTELTIRRNTKGDYDLISVARASIHPKQPSGHRLTVSPAARDAIVRQAMDGITVHPTAPEQAIQAEIAA
jgi:hypothetical protein